MDVDPFLLTSSSELSSEEDESEDEEDEQCDDAGGPDGDAKPARRKGPNWKAHEAGGNATDFEAGGAAGAAAEDGDDDGESEDDGEEDWKLVLVVRTDVGMSAGKIAAQVGHAVHRNVRKAACWNRGRAVRRKMEEAKRSNAAKSDASEGAEERDDAALGRPMPERNIYENVDVLGKWEQNGCCKKITLAASSFDELRRIRRNAIRLGVLTGLVCDAGFTELDPGTFTVLGVGPAKAEDLDELTGHLKVFRGEHTAEGAELKDLKKKMKALKKEKAKEIEGKNAELKRLRKELAKLKDERKLGIATLEQLKLKVNELGGGDSNGVDG